jgi:hypothetical protein
MNHQITSDEFFDVIDPSIDCYGAYSTDSMLESLHKAGYTIVKNIPKQAQSTDGARVYSPLAADLEDTIKLEGKVVADYSKHLTISHGFVKMVLKFTDGTKLTFSSHPTRSEVGSKLDVVYVEPITSIDTQLKRKY